MHTRCELKSLEQLTSVAPCKCQCFVVAVYWGTQALARKKSLTQGITAVASAGAPKTLANHFGGLLVFVFSFWLRKLLFFSSQGVHPLQVALKEIKRSKTSRKCSDFQWYLHVGIQSGSLLHDCFFLSHSDSPSEKEVEVSLYCLYSHISRTTERPCR